MCLLTHLRDVFVSSFLLAKANSQLKSLAFVLCTDPSRRESGDTDRWRPTSKYATGQGSGQWSPHCPDPHVCLPKGRVLVTHLCVQCGLAYWGSLTSVLRSFSRRSCSSSRSSGLVLHWLGPPQVCIFWSCLVLNTTFTVCGLQAVWYVKCRTTLSQG